MKLRFFLLFLVSIEFVVGPFNEIKCDQKFGNCLEVSKCKNASNLRDGFCPKQSANIKCCIPYQEESCRLANGICQRNEKTCDGNWVDGKCPTQPANVKCCAKKSTGDQTGQPIGSQTSQSTSSPTSQPTSSQTSQPTGDQTNPICSYNGNKNQVTCGSVTCGTTSPLIKEKLPPGNYRIGTFREYKEKPWFNLYKRIENTTKYGFGYWDYSTSIPEESCRKLVFH